MSVSYRYHIECWFTPDSTPQPLRAAQPWTSRSIALYDARCWVRQQAVGAKAQILRQDPLGDVLVCEVVRVTRGVALTYSLLGR